MEDDPGRGRQVSSVLSLDMVTIQVRDWAAAVCWYREVLGLSVVVSEEDDRFCILRAPEGGATLGLASDHPELASATGENRMAPGFAVADLDAALNDLRSKGVRVDPVIDGEGENYRLARIWDLEGNRLDLYLYTSGAG